MVHHFELQNYKILRAKIKILKLKYALESSISKNHSSRLSVTHVIMVRCIFHAHTFFSFGEVQYCLYCTLYCIRDLHFSACIACMHCINVNACTLLHESQPKQSARTADVLCILQVATAGPPPAFC